MIKLIQGYHLTATDRKHIEALFKSGHTSAKINRSHWVIIKGTPSENLYIISKTVMDRGIGLIGTPLTKSTYTYTIKYTHNQNL